jgi:glutamine amidotransferase
VRVTVFDYGAGNLHSLIKALAVPNADIVVEPDPECAVRTDVLVLPGVGAFGLAAQRLAPARQIMRDALAAGLPCLGICLGMQLLFEGSDEAEDGARGLGLVPGRATRVKARRVPHIGWNTLEDARDPALEARGLDTMYYANSYACRPTTPNVVTAWTTHEMDRFPAMIRTHNVVGVQFHPEKSSRRGVQLVHALLQEAAR